MFSEIKSKWFPEFKRELPRADGKVYVVTGTSSLSGTGFKAAETVLDKGGVVVMLNRPSSRADEALQRLRSDFGDRVHAVDCDLQSFDSVRSAAEKVKAQFPEVHCLANNAAIMGAPDEATKDGYDVQMQTNYLSHFLLTKELFPCLLAGASKWKENSRVVNHSALAAEWLAKLDPANLGKNGGNLGGNEGANMKGPRFDRYIQSKLANKVFTQCLADRIEAAELPVTTVSAHPGVCTTGLGDNALKEGRMSSTVTYLMSFIMQSSEDGSMGLLSGMLSPDITARNMYGPKRWWTLSMSGPAVAVPPEKNETDPANKELLWEASEKAIGEIFSL
ncbi:Short chain dehydrogenase family protein [Hondaea fermentalgiana]|uniref:Short chain dehydrogenase family protein n=1 Tax=Hondaea fermentalgiana TaxID=2315210 RepID=A0A2R5GB64_9STRA|nr:Short chain dehydrogenase family protein [Hondaea fermentalgiana]|eukprot:GBG28246.1 Short chain dehydrogenase family protein [Hondaea fermentalgiana]